MMAKVQALRKDAVNLDDILGQAQKQETKGTSKVMILEVPQEVKEKVTRIRELKRMIEGLETEYDLLGAEVTENVKGTREMLMHKNGYMSSVKIPDTNGESITIAWIDNYSKIALDKRDMLKNILKGMYDDYVSTNILIKVRDVDENSLRELVNMVGAENFPRFFEVERWLRPTSRFTQEQHTLEDEIRVQLLGLVRQYKPAVKTK